MILICTSLMNNDVGIFKYLLVVNIYSLVKYLRKYFAHFKRNWENNCTNIDVSLYVV